jgi:hypothetical protein
MVPKDGRLPVIDVSVLAVLVLRAASFGVELDRPWWFVVFTRGGIRFNEIRRSDRSTLSRYRIERAAGWAFFALTVLLLRGRPRGSEALQQRGCPVTGE